MLENILVPYHTKRHVKKKLDRDTKAFSKARNIGVLCSYKFLIESDHEVEDYIKALRKEGKRVSLMVFHDNSAEASKVTKNAFSKKDLNFFGYWKNDKVTTFLEKRFDYLIFLDLEYNIFMANVMARSQAQCRIGIYDEEASPFLELMIKPGEKNLRGLINGLNDMFEKIRDEK